MKFLKIPTEAQKAFVDRYVMEYNILSLDTVGRDSRVDMELLCSNSTLLSSSGHPFWMLKKAPWNKTMTFLVSMPITEQSREGIYLTFSAKAWKAIFGLAHSIILDDKTMSVGSEHDCATSVFLAVSLLAVAFPSS